jgi:hypothetical protein
MVQETTRIIATDTVDEWGRGIWWGTRPGTKPIECEWLEKYLADEARSTTQTPKQQHLQASMS